MFSRKTGFLEKTNFWKKIPDIGWKIFGRFKNCFRCMQWNMLRKKWFTLKRYSVCTNFGLWTKTLSRFVKPLLEASRATILRKKCFLEETSFILIWDLDWKTIGRVVKLVSYMTTKRNWSKTCFFKKSHIPMLFLLSSSEWLSTELRTAIYLSKRTFWGFSVDKKFSCHHSPTLRKKHVRDLVKRFQHGFQSWIQGVQKKILMQNSFWKSQTFIINSGFWAIT